MVNYKSIKNRQFHNAKLILLPTVHTVFFFWLL